ncbi:hypothetical protein [Sphingorhabdus contaminans]|uniref:hypothetical protein n=1 Tax=Sphingorhabdus contaminans TaxID=1343899 RepID=UPI003D2B94F9
MNKIILTLAALSAAAAPQIAAAKSKVPVFVEAKHVKDAPTVTLDPAKAYVLLRTPYATLSQQWKINHWDSVNLFLL